MRPAADIVVAGRYRLVHVLGEGGMGSVWLAHHVGLDTRCTVKFIHADVASHPEVRGRFEREAKAIAQLRSAHVVHVLDFGTFEDVPYLAMEYLEGEDLGRRLRRVKRLSARETIAIVAQIARALGKAHAAGLVHRDLKPENVFLAREDDHEIVKVLDFGIAKGGHALTQGSTETGALLGTPNFMSPEQIQGTKALDHRSDLWSLGVLAFLCVVGRLPFTSSAFGDLLLQIVVAPLPVPSQLAADLSPGFDAWWARACARDPAERFQSAKEEADALAEALGVIAPSASLAPPFAAPMSQPPSFPAPPRLPPTIPASLAGVAARPPGPVPATIPEGLPSSVVAGPVSRTIAGVSPASRTLAGAVVAVAALVLGGVTAAIVLRKAALSDPSPVASASAQPEPPDGGAAPKVEATGTPPEPADTAPPSSATTSHPPPIKGAKPPVSQPTRRPRPPSPSGTYDPAI